MDPAEFDTFAEEYRSLHASNIAASGESPEYFADYKMRDLARIVDGSGERSDAGRFLDFGAGVGNCVPHFRKYFPDAQLVCVDVSVKSLEIARTRFAEDASFVAFDGKVLPFDDGTFDWVFAACVFHHIPLEAQQRLLRELRRVLRVGGEIFIYEHNPLNPVTVRAVNTCPFDKNAVLIRGSAMQTRLKCSGFSKVEVSFRVFFPRWLRWLRGLEYWLRWLPLGAQYYARARR